MNDTMSSVKVVSTGTPQGCVLSPMLYILYTNDCLIKFSDDTALLGLLFNEETDHGPVVEDFVDWCDKSCLCLNAKKNPRLTLSSTKIRWR